MAKVKIENWATRDYDTSPWIASELRGLCLVGYVYGHPSKPDGSRVKTSRIQSIKGKTVLTSYNEYELGEPNPEFIKWIKSVGMIFDPENPIKVKGHKNER